MDNDAAASSAALIAAIRANVTMQDEVRRQLVQVTRALERTVELEDNLNNYGQINNSDQGPLSSTLRNSCVILVDHENESPPLNQDAQSPLYSHIKFMHRNAAYAPADTRLIIDSVKRENMRILSNNGRDPLPPSTDLRLRTNTRGIEWRRIANRLLHENGLVRSPRDVEIEYKLNLHPAVNSALFTREEVKRLEHLGEEIGWTDWVELARRLGNGRLPWQCFKIYQKYINLPAQEWTSQEDEKLRQLVDQHGSNWRVISRLMETRGRAQCMVRWRGILRPGLNKGKWTDEENELLQSAVEELGQGSWAKVAAVVKTRTEIQCRERYKSVYDPELKKGVFSKEEKEMLIMLVATHGESWASVAAGMPGRTPKQCKRNYQSLMTKLAKDQKRSDARRDAAQRVEIETALEAEQQRERTAPSSSASGNSNSGRKRRVGGSRASVGNGSGVTGVGELGSRLAQSDNTGGRCEDLPPPPTVFSLPPPDESV
ncbi:hypothetical protein BC830DRAFT_1130728 [Chytriomyces sp. MP71]|nr:hypothetical protein BC830DRAFT_1130728 [Chytriomyces sp. MP71]